MRLHRTFIVTTGAAAALLAAAACGSSTPAASSGSSGTSGTSGSSGSGSNAGGGTPALTITSPATGASVTAPFMLRVSSQDALGAPSTGDDHLHVFLDGSSSYKVMTSDQMRITGLSPGKHTILVTLQHADHSPVGPRARVSVTVSGSSGSSSNTGSGSGGGSTSGGYGY